GSSRLRRASKSPIATSLLKKDAVLHLDPNERESFSVLIHADMVNDNEGFICFFMITALATSRGRGSNVYALDHLFEAAAAPPNARYSASPHPSRSHDFKLWLHSVESCRQLVPFFATKGRSLLRADVLESVVEAISTYKFSDVFLYHAANIVF